MANTMFMRVEEVAEEMGSIRISFAYATLCLQAYPQAQQGVGADGLHYHFGAH